MIIAISGKIGSGKTTISNIIKEQLEFESDPYKSKVKIIQFSYNVKKICAILENNDVSNYYTTEGKNEYLHKFNMTRRNFMTAVGENLCNINTQIFAKSTIDIALELESKGYFVIIEDCRFKFEADLLNKHNIPIIRIERSIKYSNPEIFEFIRSYLFKENINDDLLWIKTVNILKSIIEAKHKFSSDYVIALRYYNILTNKSELDLDDYSFNFIIENKYNRNKLKSKTLEILKTIKNYA